MYSYLLGSIYLGWALGSNDAANVFGTTVTSRMLKWRTAAILGSIFVILGAYLEGAPGIETLSGLAEGQTLASAGSISLAAALAVTVLTLLKLPASTSQAVVGAILGMALYRGQRLDWNSLAKVGICWVATPLGGALSAALLYLLGRHLIYRFQVNIIRLDGYIRTGMILAGCYGAFALGANNAANVTGVFMGTSLFGLHGAAQARALALLAGGAIAFGILTFSYRVMITVGRSLYDLDPFSALVALTAHSVTVHALALVGVPVSSTQAIVGGVLGVVAVRGLYKLNLQAFVMILLGWVATPLLSGAAALAVARLFLPG